MDSLSPVKGLYYGYLSRMYALMHTLSTRSVLGFRLSTLARWIPLLLLAIGWLRNWSGPTLVILLLIAVWINFSLWRAKRDNYNRFVPSREAVMAATDLQPLPPNERVPVRASGLFSVSGRENVLLLRPAEYWRVPLGDHIVMVEELPGKYLYQFFDAASLQSIRHGWLLSGPHPQETLAVTFLARWGPEYTRFGQVYETGADDGPPPKRVTIYLTIPETQAREAVWHTIVSDARQARGGAAAAD